MTGRHESLLNEPPLAVFVSPVCPNKARVGNGIDPEVHSGSDRVGTNTVPGERVHGVGGHAIDVVIDGACHFAVAARIGGPDFVNDMGATVQTRRLCELQPVGADRIPVACGQRNPACPVRPRDQRRTD